MPPEATNGPEPMQAVALLERRLIWGIIATTLLLLMLATGVISRAALQGFEREVLPEMGREAAAAGRTIAAQIERAVSLGVPADRLQGLEPFLEQALAGRPTLDGIRFDTPAGSHAVRRPGLARAAQEITIPVATEAGPIGTLVLSVSTSVLERSAADSRWDIAIVLLVALLTTVEVLVFLTDRTISTPLRLVERLAGRIAAGDWTARGPGYGMDASGRFLSRLSAVVRRMNERRQHVLWLAGEVAREAPGARAAVERVVRGLLPGRRFAEGGLRTEAPPRSPAVARAPLFLYVFAEQLSTSFIPIYARSLATPGGWVPEALAVGLPITVFAGVIAVASPFAAGLASRFGARAVLGAGCVPAMLGYAMAMQAGSIEAFAAGRAVTAAGYALITIACQTYLVAAGDTGGRGRVMAVFVQAAMTGAVCGTAIGAVLADRVGYAGTFGASALLTAVAGGLALRTMDRGAGRREAVAEAGGYAGALREALRNRRFLALVVFAAVPAKLVLTGFVFYVCPLLLLSLGDTQPEIGRQVMLYAATMLVTIRVGAWVADRMGAATSGIALAGAATGIGLLLPLGVPAAVAVPVAIAVVGLSQGLASAPMLAVVPELCPALAARLGVATLYGYLRFAERLGSIAGPLVAAGLVGVWGFTGAMVGIGALSLAATAAYWAVAMRGRRG